MPVTDDTAGAGPDEALADAAEEEAAVSTTTSPSVTEPVTAEQSARVRKTADAAREES